MTITRFNQGEPMTDQVNPLDNLRLFAPADPLIGRVPSEDLCKEEENTPVYQVVCYVLSVKGGFYSNQGEGNTTTAFTEAMIFRSERIAYDYRRRYAKLNDVDTAELLEVTATIRRV